MITSTMNEAPPSKRQQQAGLASFANFALGGLSDEKVSAPATAASETSSSKHTISKNGARFLIDAQLEQQQREQLQVPDETKLQARKATAAEQQATMQRQMKFLMNDPLLWAQFKERLAQSNHTGKTGVQKVLQEFLAENKQIAMQDDDEQKRLEEAKKKTKKTARMSILESVQNFTNELAGERSEGSMSAGTTNSKRSASMGLGSSFTEQHSQKPQPRSASMGMGVTNIANALRNSTLGSTTPSSTKTRASTPTSLSPITTPSLDGLRRAASNTLAATSLGAALNSSSHTITSSALGSLAERDDEDTQDDNDDDHHHEEDATLGDSFGSFDISLSSVRQRWNRKGSMESVQEQIGEEGTDDEDEDFHGSGQIEVDWPES